MTQFSPALVVLACLLAVGCGARQMYPGDPLPREDVAVLEGSRTIDGVRIYFAGEDGNGNEFAASRIEIRPGRREIRVHFTTPESNFVGGYLPVQFEARGGHSYRVRGMHYEGSMWIWIEDTYSHEIVGGRKPPD